MGGDAPTGALHPIEVARRGLHVDHPGFDAEDGRDPVTDRGQAGREARPAGHDRAVEARHDEAGGRDPSDDLAEQVRAGDAPGRLRSGREDPPEVAQAGRAEQGVRDRVEDHVAVGVTAEARRSIDHEPAEGQPRARPEGVTVGPVSDPDLRHSRTRLARRASADGRRDAAEIVGQRHLEIALGTGNGMDGQSTGLEQGGLIGERLRPVGRERPIGPTEDVGPDALRCLRGAEVGAIPRADDRPVGREALDRVPDRHDRDRGAVGSRRQGDGRHELRWDERSRPVMDEHHLWLGAAVG